MARKSQELQQWQRFFSISLQCTLNYESFKEALRRQYAKWPLSAADILEAWGAVQDRGFVVRPRYMKYFEQMLHAHLITDEDALMFVLRNFKSAVARQEELLIVSGSAKGEYRPVVEAAILERIAYQMLNFRDATISPGDRAPVLRILKPLIMLLSTFNQALGSSAPLSGPSLEMANELGKLIAAYINDLSLSGLLTSDNGGPSKALRKSFGRHLPVFVTLVAPTSADLAENLSLLQRQSSLFEAQLSEPIEDGIANDLNALSYQDSVLELSLVTTKAALYIYLNAMLCGRPMADDAALFTFLNARYNDNVPSLIADLISASFDVLANAVNRTEPQASINLYRSFISNKLPVLLESFSNLLFPPLTIESCITDALNRLDPSGDPFSTQAFDPTSITGILSDARQEFLFACALHGLIPESSIESILGDVPMQSLPESGKYAKSDLVDQCTANPARIKELVGELENMDGNSAEIVAALVEIIQMLCANKDTMTLKTVCNALSCKIFSMDIMLLFVEPAVILQPLCSLLENWQNQEDQSESHPVYEEFGSVFLLVLAFRHHFTLQERDLGIGPSESFLRIYFRDARTSRRPADLTEAERQRLGGWIKGLYEADAISDELMSTCTPKEFYLLIPTLFDQSLKASQAGALALDTVKSGLQFLLEPSLLPSLVAGFGWAARKLWETTSVAPHLEHLLPLVACLVKPASLSPEASSLHETVLTITAYSLERALAHVQKLHPRRRDIDPLLNALRPHLHQVRSATATHTELETWSTTPHGGMFAALKHSLHALVNWSSAALIKQEGSASQARQSSGGAPNYTHRLVLACVHTFGAFATLCFLLSEASNIIKAGKHVAEVPLDVLTAAVCAPAAASARSAMSLRQALHLALEDAYSYSMGKNGRQQDKTRAELIVRLSRRVESYSPAGQLVQQSAEDGADTLAGGDGTANMMMGLEGNPELDNAGLGGSTIGAAADANNVLAGLEEFMDTNNSGDIFMT